jgi:uncharacterized membrane protein
MLNGGSSMFASAIAAAIALVSSVLLLWRGRKLPGCASGSNCDDVTASRWASVGQVPVALPGAAVYAAMMICALFGGRDALASLSVIAAGAAVWFLGIQIFVLRRVCLYCATAHLAALAAAIFSLHDKGDWRFVSAGAIAALGLITLQVLLPKRTHQMLVASRAVTEPVRVVNTPVKIDPIAPPISVLKGQVSLEWNLFPHLGKVGAAHAVVNLMDYTCEKCRSLHKVLSGAIADYGDDLAVVLISVPLESKCNRFVNVLDPRHVNACEYSRLALAVWYAAPANFPAFHDWLMTGASPPNLGAARQRADILLGARSLSDALSDPRIDSRIAQAGELYVQTKPWQLPKLLLPEGLLWGAIESREELIRILEQSFAPAHEQVPVLAVG